MNYSYASVFRPKLQQQNDKLHEGGGSSWAEQIDAADQEAKKDKYESCINLNSLYSVSVSFRLKVCLNRYIGGLWLSDHEKVGLLATTS